MKKYCLGVCLFIWGLSWSPSFAVPVVEWNTGYVYYVASDENEVSFGISTEATMGGAYVVGNGLREEDGWWTTLDAMWGTIGISFRFFEVNYCDLIDWNLAESSVAFADNLTREYGSLFLNYDESLYLGFRLGGADYCPDVEYGWMQLYFDGDTVTVLSSATERTGLGIYAGTGIAIPEPATMGMLLMGAMGLIALRKPSRHKTCFLST